MTVPNMNEIRWFMPENGPRTGFHMLSIWKTKLATWRPSWIKISKWGYVHQWATIDNVHAWPCPGHNIKYRALITDRSILTNSKPCRTAAIFDQSKIYFIVFSIIWVEQTGRHMHGKTGWQVTHTKILISTYMYSHRVYTFEKLGNSVQKSD